MPRHISHTNFDQKQFEALFKLLFKHLSNFVQGYVEDADAAQDICQKVFIALWEKRAEIDPAQNVKS